MIFSGFSDLNVDPKQRLALPSKFRAQFDLEHRARLDALRASRPTNPPDEKELERLAAEAKVWCVTPWPGRGLVIFPLVVWREFAAKRGGSLTPSKSRLAADASLFGLTEQIEMDSAGRLTIPGALLKMAGFSGAGAHVTMVGYGYHLEVTDQAKWKENLESTYRHLDNLDDPETNQPPAAGDARNSKETTT